MVRPSWWAAVPVPSAHRPSAIDNPSLVAPFQIGDVFGYVGSDGGILHVERVLFRVALSAAGFVNYSRLGTDWILMSPSGERLLGFSGSGYPLLSADGSRLFLVKTDLTGIEELKENDGIGANPRNTAEGVNPRSTAEGWSRDFPAMMTSVSLQGNHLLVGLMNGALQLLDRQGAVTYQYSPPGSRIQVILGCAVSPDGSLLAAVSGIDPQVFTTLRRKGSTYLRLASARLGSDFRREILISFSPDSKYLVFEEEDSVGVFDPGTAKLVSRPIRGTLTGAAFLLNGVAAAFLGREGDRYTLQIIRPLSSPLAAEAFTARETFLGQIDGGVLLGIDDRLIRIDVEAM